MDSGNQEVALELHPLLRVYKDGRVERLIVSDFVPPSPEDPQTGVSSKDVLISPDSAISARFYLPKLTQIHQKLPLLVYFHGGAFCLGSPASFHVHRYLNLLASHANFVIVSAQYRLAPEHPLPTAYDDSWATLQWVSSQAKGRGGAGDETWLIDHADFDRVFLGGDSAGGNIVHNIAMRAGAGSLHHNVRIEGAFLVHPYFWGSEAVGSELTADPDRRSLYNRLWEFVSPSSAAGMDDPVINPLGPGAPSLSGLGCSRVLVCIAGKDMLRDRGRLYWEAVRKSGWEGEAELFEVEGEDPEFHVFDPATENAMLTFKRLASFLNQ